MTTSIGNVAISVASLDRSVSFYTHVVGLAVLATVETDDVTEIIVGAEHLGSQLMLALHKHETPPVRPSGIWKTFISTEDIQGIVSRAQESGAEVVDGPIFVKRFNVHLAFIKDPDGYLIEVGQRGATRTAATSRRRCDRQAST